MTHTKRTINNTVINDDFCIKNLLITDFAKIKCSAKLTQIWLCIDEMRIWSNFTRICTQIYWKSSFFQTITTQSRCNWHILVKINNFDCTQSTSQAFDSKSHQFQVTQSHAWNMQLVIAHSFPIFDILSINLWNTFSA